MHAELLAEPTPRTAQNQNTKPSKPVIPDDSAPCICTLFRMPDWSAAHPSRGTCHQYLEQLLSWVAARRNVYS